MGGCKPPVLFSNELTTASARRRKNMKQEMNIEVQADMERCFSAYERGLEIEPITEEGQHEKGSDISED